MEGRRPHLRSLAVYLRGERIGTLETRGGGGRLRFTYTPETVARYVGGTYLLSLSLPVRETAYANAETRPYFDGLLPEGTAREAIARAVGSSPDNTFALLERLGRDCAGAVVLLPPDEELAARSAEVRWLSDDELRDKLGNIDVAPLGVEPGREIRLSLAGAQPKLVVTRDRAGRFGLPLGDMPTTQILKPARANYEDLVTNEAFCLRVARCSGAETADAEVEVIAGIETLVIERFDRTFEGATLVRVHQEDFCQAAGVLPQLKYEADGGPRFRDLVEIVRGLRTPGLTGAEIRLWHALLLNFMLGNADAHAKNFSLLTFENEADGPTFYDIRVAPLYDIVCTAVYRELTPRLAMSIGGVDDPADITLESFREEARASQLGGAEPLRLMQELGARILACARATATLAHAEGWHRPVIDEVVRICEQRAAQLGIDA